MARIACIALVLLLAFAPAAGATRISTVGSGSADSETCCGPYDLRSWMPEIAANTVFRVTRPGVYSHSLEALAALDATPIALQATTLWRGDPQLMFADRVYAYSNASFGASFINTTP